MRKEKETKLSLIASSKSVKLVSATLLCLMLTSVIVGSGIKVVPTKATPKYPWEDFFTEYPLWVTRTNNPYWGYYGGYFELWARVKAKLAEIGITLKTEEFSDYEWYDRVWDTGWNKTYAQGGWDLLMIEWWLQPHSLVPWFESMVYGDLTPQDDPEGYNIQHWNNTDADELLRAGMQTSDAETKRDKLWLWQKWFMHDPPWVDVYTPKIYEMVGSYVEGYNPSGCWWYDIRKLTINTTEFDKPYIPQSRKDLGNDVLIYAVSEDVWNLHPTYMDYYTEEQMARLLFLTLYQWGIKWDSWDKYMLGEDPSELNASDWSCEPSLAAGDPIMSDDGMKATINLRHGVKWSDGEPVTATDVQFTFNTCTLNMDAKNTGIGDFIVQIKNCTYVDEHTVDFYLNYPVPISDLKSCLSNDWGGGSIMPFHRLKGYMGDPGKMKMDDSNTAYGDPSKWLPSAGPFVMTECVPGHHLTFEKNLDYFGYDENIVGVSGGWGPYGVNKVILQWIPDAPTRFLALQKNEVDFGEYSTGPVSKFQEWADPEVHPNVRVFQYWYPATNAIWFNLDNPVLSNRYVRLAIAHAVPYEEIMNEVLPGWGIATAKRGKTHILPWHNYTEPTELGGTEVSLYNTDPDVPPYEFDLTKAVQYMNMWWYSQAYSKTEGEDPTLGPMGDFDFNGVVEMDDYFIWLRCLLEGIGDIGELKKITLPGQDKDADADNNWDIELMDYGHSTCGWRINVGTHYPFTGAY